MAALRPIMRTVTTRSRQRSRQVVGASLYRQLCPSIVGHRHIERLQLAHDSRSSVSFGQRWRGISSTARACHGDHEEGFEHAQTVEISWQSPKGDLRKTEAKCGMNLMRVAHAHGIDLEGACEGVCACSTCHVILSGEVFDELPEPSEDEEDMLDLAFGLTETSRLGCQVLVTPEMDGIVVKLPAATRNFYVDGHVPQPH